MKHLYVNFGEISVFEISCGTDRQTDRQTVVKTLPPLLRDYTMGVGNGEFDDDDYFAIV